MRECQSAKVPNDVNVKVRECDNARNQSARYRECESARVPKCESVNMRWCDSAKVQKCENCDRAIIKDKLPECQIAKVGECEGGEVP